jgi:hypothetical protein
MCKLNSNVELKHGPRKFSASLSDPIQRFFCRFCRSRLRVFPRAKEMYAVYAGCVLLVSLGQDDLKAQHSPKLVAVHMGQNRRYRSKKMSVPKHSPNFAFYSPEAHFKKNAHQIHLQHLQVKWEWSTRVV